MTTSTRRDLIEERIQKALSPSYLEVIDESNKHIGHAGHQGGGRHFAVVIKASCFEGCSRIEAHKRIYALFTDMMPDQIHALRIKIMD